MFVKFIISSTTQTLLAFLYLSLSVGSLVWFAHGLAWLVDAKQKHNNTQPTPSQQTHRDCLENSPRAQQPCEIGTNIPIQATTHTQSINIHRLKHTETSVRNQASIFVIYTRTLYMMGLCHDGTVSSAVEHRPATCYCAK